MNPYDIKTKDLPESRPITDKAEILKIKLIESFLKLVMNKPTDEASKIVGLDQEIYKRLLATDHDAISMSETLEVFDRMNLKADFSISKK